ncbi:hypothetical protein T484DRAFT_1826149 [Baffinella frigidus]|nr:hypothetical protein T484DRAFT_1826149 [Cryptophyta sp. CCMP2293]
MARRRCILLHIAYVGHEAVARIAPSDIAQTYWDVAKQGKSCWTHEIDVRPFNENW